MNANEKRRNICSKCIIVTGIHSKTPFDQIQPIFPESRCGEPLISAGLSLSDNRSWILNFPTNKDARSYIDQKSVNCSEGHLVISPCDCPCDIPEEWILEDSDSVPSCEDVNVQGRPTPSGGFIPAEHLLQQLTNMGFSKDDSIKGLFHTGNRDAHVATDWIINYKDKGAGLPYPMIQNPVLPYQYAPNFPPVPMLDPRYIPQGVVFPPRAQFPGYPIEYHQNVRMQTPAYQIPTVMRQQSVENPSVSKDSAVKVTAHRQQDSPEIIYRRQKSQQTNIVQNIVQKEIPEKSKAIKVTKLPLKTTEENLRLFFENERRSGGGDVDDVTYDSHNASAVVTFVEDNVVETILARSPLQFLKADIGVEIYKPVDSRKVQVDSRKDLNQEHCLSKDISSCVVEVRGVKTSTQKMALQYYFEGKHGADEDIIDIDFDEEKNIYLLTFESESAVDKIVGKTHTIDKALLDVRKYVPPDRYPNKVLVKDIKSTVTKEVLINYMEGRTKLDVDDVNFSESDPSTAVVTFCEDIQIDKIQQACEKKSLEKVNLQIKPVIVSNCIIVSEFSEKTTDDSLEYYFDNIRKSGVEGVANVQMENDYCLVYFEDPNDAEAACRRSHIIDNCLLKVGMFYECLGPPLSDAKEEDIEPVVDYLGTNIQPIILSSINPNVLQFLMNSRTSQDTVSREMNNVNANITWPSSTLEPIKLECLLSRDNPDIKQIAETWEQDVRFSFEQLIRDITVQRHYTVREIWKGVLDEMNAQQIKDTDSAIISFNIEACEIHVVGQKSFVLQISTKIERILTEKTDEVNKTRQLICADVPIEQFQQSILQDINFWSDIGNKYPELEIDVLMTKPVVKLKGMISDINMVKIEMYEKLACVKQHCIGQVSLDFVKFLSQPEIETLIKNEIIDCGISGIWELDDNRITIYSFTADDATTIEKIFKNKIICMKIPVEDQNKTLCYSKDWKQFVENIKQEYQDQNVFIQITAHSGKEIMLLCTGQIEAKSIRERIQDFIFENGRSEQAIHFSAHQMKFIKHRHQDKIDLAKMHLQANNVDVDFDSDCIVVKGNKKGKKAAMDELGPIIKLMQSQMKKEDVRPMVPGGLGFGSAVESFITEDGQCVMVLCCDISGLDVDVIVSPADQQLSNSGGLSKIIADEGGTHIQRECKDYRRSHGLLNEGDVFSTSPGTLKCKMVVHAVGPVWQNQRSNAKVLMTKCVYAILSEADRKHFKTLAIPALSTGTSNYPINEAANIIALAVGGYFRKNPDSSLKTVYFCDIAAKVADIFVNVASKIFKSSDKRPISSKGHKDGYTVAQHIPQIQVVINDLAKMQVDVIVNTTSQDLQLNQSGAVSASLLKHGGNSILQECQDQYGGTNLAFGDIAVTSGGLLNCQYIFHGALPQWKRDGSSLQTLSKFINNCMVAATQRGCTSISFPSVGTGRLNYPPGEVANEMFKAVGQYFQNPLQAFQNSTTYQQNMTQMYGMFQHQLQHVPTVNKVVFVLYHKDVTTIKAFEDEEARRNPKASVDGETRPKPKLSTRRKDRLS
ncbi:protein mono-ADP-ribosyltransferase PARP14-like [Mytilus trossulus]|uniref:protein mono-ADP-ribosyltransferase PARP14-like n=1 Tax=Mytilus trossulus TaxID=6551 RepID=UPI0030078438